MADKLYFEVSDDGFSMNPIGSPRFTFSLFFVFMIFLMLSFFFVGPDSPGFVAKGTLVLILLFWLRAIWCYGGQYGYIDYNKFDKVFIVRCRCRGRKTEKNKWISIGVPLRVEVLLFKGGIRAWLVGDKEKILISGKVVAVTESADDAVNKVIFHTSRVADYFGIPMYSDGKVVR